MKILNSIIIILLIAILGVGYLIYNKDDKSKEIKALKTTLNSQSERIAKLENEIKNKFSKDEFEKEILIFKDKVLSAVAKKAEENEDFLTTKIIESEKKYQKLEDAMVKLIEKQKECCKKPLAKKTRVVKKPQVKKKKKYYKPKPIVRKYSCVDTEIYKNCVNRLLERKNNSCDDQYKKVPKEIIRKKKSRERELDESTVLEEAVIITSINPEYNKKIELPLICSQNIVNFRNTCYKKHCSNK